MDRLPIDFHPNHTSGELPPWWTVSLTMQVVDYTDGLPPWSCKWSTQQRPTVFLNTKPTKIVLYQLYIFSLSLPYGDDDNCLRNNLFRETVLQITLYMHNHVSRCTYSRMLYSNPTELDLGTLQGAWR